MTYPGGKNGAGVYQQIINRIPPHRIYVEPFLGGGAVMRLKRRAVINIGIDIDREVIEAFPKALKPGLTLSVHNSLVFLPKLHDDPDTFIYCDPPYLMTTRSKPSRIYRFEFSEHNHRRLLSILKELHCMVMISGYPNAIYDDTLSRWWTHDYMTTNRGGGHVMERLWMNYPPPTQLHDYRYLGNTFREREKIKRQKERWVMKLAKMSDLRRCALAAAIAELDASLKDRPEERAAPDPIVKKIDPDPLPALCNKCGWPDPIAMDAGTRSTEPTRGALVSSDPFDIDAYIARKQTRKKPAT